MLKTEIEQLEEQKQKLAEENRTLKIREDKALHEHDVMQKKLGDKEADLKRVYCGT